MQSLEGDWGVLAGGGSFRAKPGRIRGFCGLVSRVALEGPPIVHFQKVQFSNCDPMSLTLHGDVRVSFKPMEGAKEDQRMWCMGSSGQENPLIIQLLPRKHH